MSSNAWENAGCAYGGHPARTGSQLAEGNFSRSNDRRHSFVLGVTRSDRCDNEVGLPPELQTHNYLVLGIVHHHLGVQSHRRHHGVHRQVGPSN